MSRHSTDRSSKLVRMAREMFTDANDTPLMWGDLDVDERGYWLVRAWRSLNHAPSSGM